MSRLAVLAAALLMAAGPASAHHAFAADYEAGNEGTVSGVVTEVMFRNPHARYYLEVTGDDGSTELWDLETLNLMMLDDFRAHPDIELAHRTLNMRPPDARQFNDLPTKDPMRD